MGQSIELNEAIEAWRKNSHAEWPQDANTETDTKALCDVFNNPTGRGNLSCEGCPIAEAVERKGCIDTPWYAAKLAWKEWTKRRGPRSRAMFAMKARTQLEFLESVRDGTFVKEIKS